MEAILKFDLSDESDFSDYKTINQANNMSSILFELLHNKKKGLEYWIDGQEKVDDYDVLDHVFEEIWDLVQDNNLDTSIFR